MSADIIERRQQPASCMGLFLPGNAVNALTELGLREHLMLRGSPIEYQELRDHHEKRLAEITMGKRRHWPPFKQHTRRETPMVPTFDTLCHPLPGGLNASRGRVARATGRVRRGRRARLACTASRQANGRVALGDRDLSLTSSKSPYLLQREG
ncbi:hypothetical protein [Streptomyces sp. NPDC050263]|uniref:hypothetical protein n=1 Tax=Streptomyces sp. NPDC050263 TaxID=3155037 RepID=UPI00341FC946